jgi:hypothetical protein
MTRAQMPFYSKGRNDSGLKFLCGLVKLVENREAECLPSRLEAPKTMRTMEQFSAPPQYAGYSGETIRPVKFALPGKLTADQQIFQRSFECLANIQGARCHEDSLSTREPACVALGTFPV